MYKRDHVVRAGNDRFEGFAVDLIAEVASMLEFEYDIYLVHDGKFGSKMDDGNWNGMIGELLSGVCYFINGQVIREYGHIVSLSYIDFIVCPFGICLVTCADMT